MIVHVPLFLLVWIFREKMTKIGYDPVSTALPFFKYQMSPSCFYYPVSPLAVISCINPPLVSIFVSVKKFLSSFVRKQIVLNRSVPSRLFCGLILKYTQQKMPFYSLCTNCMQSVMWVLAGRSNFSFNLSLNFCFVFVTIGWGSTFFVAVDDQFNDAIVPVEERRTSLGVHVLTSCTPCDVSSSVSANIPVVDRAEGCCACVMTETLRVSLRHQPRTFSFLPSIVSGHLRTMSLFH